jgi:uncharacterized lipoprotein NlpE involved in copper resistance
MSKKWIGPCSIAVLATVLVVGCSKKEAEQAAENVADQAEGLAQEAAEQVGEAGGSVAGTYSATLSAADTPGRKVMLVLNADNTASMSVDYMNDQPALVENGTWAWNPTASAVDLALSRDVAGAAVSMNLSFAMSGDTLRMNNPAEAGFGTEGMALVKEAAGEAGHEGHSH